MVSLTTNHKQETLNPKRLSQVCVVPVCVALLRVRPLLPLLAHVHLTCACTDASHLATPSLLVPTPLSLCRLESRDGGLF